MKLSNRFKVGLVVAILATTMTATMSFNTMRLTSKTIMAQHNYTTFVEMLANIRSLKSSYTTEAYGKIDPDMVEQQETLARVSYQPSKVEEQTVMKLTPSNCIIQYRVRNEVVSADRLFQIEIRTRAFTVADVKISELRKLW